MIDRFLELDIDYLKMQLNISQIMNIAPDALLKMDIVNYFQLSKEALKIQAERNRK